MHVYASVCSDKTGKQNTIPCALMLSVFKSEQNQGKMSYHIQINSQTDESEIIHSHFLRNQHTKKMISSTQCFVQPDNGSERPSC